MLIRSYDISYFEFKTAVQCLMNVTDLTKIHLISNENYDVFNEINDQNTLFHTRFYARMNDEFIQIYERFIKEEITKFHGDFLYQRSPTFRISLPNNVAVGSFHKDTDFNHHVDEINFVVPLTRSFNTNTIWVESTPGLADYAPCDLQHGEYLEFDGANLMHGNKINKTSQSRVSFDFRILPSTSYNDIEHSKKSVTQSKTMSIGDYWCKL